MRHLASILALFILSLSVVPCADTVTGGEHGNEIIEFAQQQDSHQDHDNGDDNCSPFCICCCCHSHIVIAMQGKTNGLPEKPIATFSFFQDSFSGGIIQFVWHPPKRC